MKTELFRSVRVPWVSTTCMYFDSNDAEMLYHCHRCDKTKGKNFNKDALDDLKAFEVQHEQCLARLNDDEVKVMNYLTSQDQEKSDVKKLADATGIEEPMLGLILQGLYLKNIVQPSK